MKSTIINIKTILSLLMIATLFYACDDFKKFELPEAGSKADETPPTASFSYTQDSEDYQKYAFGNLSSSATSYSWNFGDGNTTTGKDVENVFPGEGTYTVTLTASDALGASDTYTETIEVIEPEVPIVILPKILEAGFEDMDLEGGVGDGRDSWRCSFGTIMQITSDPVYSGLQAAKFPSDPGDARVAYQELEVSPNADYRISYFYTMKEDQPGTVTVRIMDGPITEMPTNDENVLATSTGTDNTDSDAYLPASVEFNTGATNTIAILITSVGAESRLDDVSIEVVE